MIKTLTYSFMKLKKKQVYIYGKEQQNDILTKHLKIPLFLNKA